MADGHNSNPILNEPLRSDDTFDSYTARVFGCGNEAVFGNALTKAGISFETFRDVGLRERDLPLTPTAKAWADAFVGEMSLWVIVERGLELA
jgi:hypothetical protein